MAAPHLEWLASQMTEVELAPGEVSTREGASPDRMFCALEGELCSQPSNPEAPAFVARAPAITGLLPYSRMTHFPATARAVVRTRAAVFPADRFHEMLEPPRTAPAPGAGAGPTAFGGPPSCRAKRRSWRRWARSRPGSARTHQPPGGRAARRGKSAGSLPNLSDGRARSSEELTLVIATY